MGLGTLLKRTALPVDRAQPVNQPAESPRRTHTRSELAGATFAAAIAAYRATYGYLPTAHFAGMLGVPGAWKATKLYANIGGSLPYQGYRQMPNGTSRRTTPTPPFLAAPMGTRRTPFLVYSSAVVDLLWHGNSIGVVASRQNGWPTAWVGVPADCVGVAWLDPSDALPAGARVYRVGTLTFSEVDVIHFQAPGTPGALRGLGVLETQMAALQTAAEQNRQAYNVAANHGVPTGILTSEDPDISTEELRENKTAWLEAQRDRTIAALGWNTKFQPIAWSPEAGQMIEARQFSLTDVENSFELPNGWAGGAQQARTYANREQDITNLLKTSWLAGGIPVLEQTLTMQMPRGQYAQANPDALLRSDSKTRAEVHAISLGPNGWRTRDEVREIEDEPPLGGDDGDGAAWKKPPGAQQPIQATATVGEPAAIEGSTE